MPAVKAGQLAEAQLTRTSVPVTDGTPRLSPIAEWITRTVALLCVAYSGYYIVWRWTATLNLHSWWISIPLVLAETWGFVTFAVLAHTGWRLKLRAPAPPTRPCTVDVFVTTFDEPVELLRRTAAGAIGISYPHQTYILDDGRRADVKALAEELGIGYITRDNNEHAKAGNLNNALRQTDGEFILQLDADHVPLPHILDRLLGFFDDDSVAFVQTPQDFYNTDSFSHSINRTRRRIYEEQRLFFLLIQPGKDRTNSAFFCGSCGVIRRSALQEIGGFSTETITEDMDTAMVLHARGWKSAYYGESLAYGLAPGSALAFQVQRLRWGQGSMQILRKRNPLKQKGLTWAQKLNYLSSTVVYLDGLFFLILCLAPIMFFAVGAFPLQVPASVFLKRFVPYIVLMFAGSMLLARGTNSPWRAAVYGMLKFPIYILALSALFTRKPLSFKVTPKGATDVPFRVYAPQLAILVISVGVFLWSVIAAGNGWVDYSNSGWGTIGWELNLLWLTFNAAAAAAALRMSLSTKQRRSDYRFPEKLPVDFAPADVPVAIAAQGVTSNLNAGGMLLRTSEIVELGARYRFNIPLRSGFLETTGTIVSTQPVDVAGLALYQYGVQFDPLDNAAAAAIDVHCSQHVVPKEFMRYRLRHPAFERAVEWVKSLRRARREFLDLPVRVRVRDANGTRDLGLAILEDYSTRGFSLLLEQPIAPGSLLELQLPYVPEGAGGIVVSCRSLETPQGEEFVVGASCVEKRLPLPAPESAARRMVRRFENWIAA